MSLDKFRYAVGNAIATRVCDLDITRGRPVEHRYEHFSILLPPDHMLPIYQRRHPRYDRFLPLLAGHLSPDETVVDVGANVGDTLAAMADRNARLRYVCIEADEVFFGWLRRNIARVQAARPELRADAIQALIGRSVGGAALEGHGGTKHAVPGAAGGVESRPLDHVLAERDCGPVRLLKSDVDGFDYDVIDSSLRVVDADGPLLFFECQCDTAAQKTGYERTLAALAERGYVDWTVFDNFGATMLRTADLDVVFQLMEYVWQQTRGRSTRRIYYCDILAARAADRALVDRVLAEYDA